MAIHSSSVLMINLDEVNTQKFFVNLFAQDIDIEILNPKELGQEFCNAILQKPVTPDFTIEQLYSVNTIIKQSLNYNMVESLLENRAKVGLDSLKFSKTNVKEAIELSENVQEYQQLQKSFKKLLKISKDPKKAKAQKAKLKAARAREKELHTFLKKHRYNFNLNRLSKDWLKKLVLIYTSVELENKIFHQSKNIFKVNKDSDTDFVFIATTPAEKSKLIKFLDEQKIDHQLVSWNKEIVIWKNPTSLAPFQNIAQSLGTIGKKEYDPSGVISIFFALFFAICINDALYGLVISLITGYFLFFKNLHKKFLSIFTLFFFSGLASILVGAISNSWGGNLLSSTIINPFLQSFQLIEPLDPNKNVVINNFLRNNGGINPIVAMLGFAVFIGLVHIFTAFLINIRNTTQEDGTRETIFEINWVIFLLSLLATFIGMLSANIILSISSPILAISTVGLFIFNPGKGVTGKIMGGFIKLYEIVSFLADMLSYTRLIAVGLTGSIIATVINLLASIAYGAVPPVFGFIIAALILIGGHGFNLIVSMFGAYINPLRLHYVEFMPKFFQGKARALNPIDNELTYAIVE